MEPIWMFRLAFGFVLLAPLVVSIFLIIPNTVRYYALWKASRQEKHLAACFTEGGIALFLVVAVVSVLLQRLFLWWQASYAS